MFTWTDSMGHASTSTDPAVEAATRAAICTAATFLDGIPRDAPPEKLPRWNMGEFASAANDLAKEMEAEVRKVMGNLGAGLQGAHMLSLAVRMAILVRDRGGGDAGWAAVAQAFQSARTVRHARAR